MVQVADGNRQGVGGIIGRGQFLQMEERLHHELHLSFIGIAITANGLFDLIGVVFKDGQVRLCKGQQGDTAGLPDRKGRFDVLLEIEFFNRAGARLVAFDQLGQAVEQDHKPLGVGKPGRGTDHAIFNVLILTLPSGLDKPKTCCGQPGIYAEDEHVRLAIFYSLDRIFGDIQVGVDILYVIQLFDIFDGFHHLDGFFNIQGDFLFGHITDAGFFRDHIGFV